MVLNYNNSSIRVTPTGIYRNDVFTSFPKKVLHSKSRFISVFNSHIIINGYEFTSNGKFQKTVFALFHKYLLSA